MVIRVELGANVKTKSYYLTEKLIIFSAYSHLNLQEWGSSDEKVDVSNLDSFDRPIFYVFVYIFIFNHFEAGIEHASVYCKF